MAKSGGRYSSWLSPRRTMLIALLTGISLLVKGTDLTLAAAGEMKTVSSFTEYLFALPLNITAQTGSMDWNTASTWDSGVVPTSADDVIIPSGSTITINGSAVCQNITIEAGGTLVMASGATLAVEGDFTNNGTFEAGTGTVTMNGDGAVIAGSSSISFFGLKVGAAYISLNADIAVAETMGWGLSNLIQTNSHAITLNNISDSKILYVRDQNGGDARFSVSNFSPSSTVTFRMVESAPPSNPDANNYLNRYYEITTSQDASFTVVAFVADDAYVLTDVAKSDLKVSTLDSSTSSWSEVTGASVNSSSIYIGTLSTSANATLTLSAVQDLVLPTAVLSGDGSGCPGTVFDLTLNLTGTGPWDVVYSDGTQETTLNNISSSPYTFSVSPSVSTTYSLVSVSDANTSGVVSGSATISVSDLDAGVLTTTDSQGDVCEVFNPTTISGSQVSASSDPNIVFAGYRWEVSYDGVNFSDLGVTSTSYNPPTLSGSTWYRRVARYNVNGEECSGISNVIGWEVFDVPTLADIDDIEICDTETYSATAQVTSGNSSNYTYTISSDDASAPMPDETANTTGVFEFVPEETTGHHNSGQFTYTISASGDDSGACSATVQFTATIYTVPEISMLTSCSSGDDGSIQMSGEIGYPASGDIEYRLYDVQNDTYTDWSTTTLFEGLNYGLYTVYARNAAWPSCESSLSDEVEVKTVTGVDLEVCQGQVLTEDDVLEALSYCFEWSGKDHQFDGCTDGSQTYTMAAASSGREAYDAGNLVQYAVVSTFKPTTGKVSIKDCKIKDENASYSVYVYPFYPNQPDYNYVETVYDVCPQSAVVDDLDPETIYVLVLNSSDADTEVCSDFWFTAADKVQASTDFVDVNWYLSDDLTDTPLASGPTFNPLDYPDQTGLTGTDIPGTWTFYVGCDYGTCREPIQFIVNPLPVVEYQNTTVCSGEYTNIQLVSTDNQDPANLIANSRLEYEWYPTILSGSASWDVSCDESNPCTGSTISVQLTHQSGDCPVVRFMVRGSVGGCWGEWYPVDVTVIDRDLYTIPTEPEDLTVTCIDDVPAAALLTLSHPCLPDQTPTAKETDNGGSGCPDDPLVITRTWTFEDACNNFEYSQNITVIDNIAPSFTKPADAVVEKNAFCVYSVLPEVTGYPTDISDNCSSGLQATYSDAVDNTNPCEVLITRTWSLVDDCGNAVADQQQTIRVVDLIPPVLQPVSARSYCVDRLRWATFNGLSMPDTDIAEERPEYYTFKAGSTDLDLNPTSHFSDNCSSASEMTLHWTIVDSNGDTVEDANGNLLENMSGLPSTLGVDILFESSGEESEYYTIRYWVEDQCGNVSNVQEGSIEIIPRPGFVLMN
ncbi:G8 domain-containing protein [Mangrovibacterium diazotrophicum]|uniref:G8 domain-containing protein n=1 Tax=Mangrovibacterium diazotrophicum TaxID=1261403 RepID=A0A419W8L6_9BACT|nr:G8 domain-containing protein [Mangrovibacterium diazotrophicum]RKD91798.1 G8 domain-containing protein [Mangrovibacterium diazotrophicum]